MKENKETKIRAMLAEGKKAKEIAETLGCNKVYVYQVSMKMKKEALLYIG